MASQTLRGLTASDALATTTLFAVQSPTAAVEMAKATGAQLITFVNANASFDALGAAAAITKTSIGLGSVENTALSTWAGSTNLTTLGTIATGTVPVARVSGLGSLATQSGTFSGTSSGTNTGDNVQTITLTTDASGSGTGTFAVTLATVNSNVGSFTSADITVNAKGLVTAAANGSGGGGLTIGSTAVSGGTAGRVLFEAAGPVVSDDADLTWDGTNFGVGSGGQIQLGPDIYLQRTGDRALSIASTNGAAALLDVSLGAVVGGAPGFVRIESRGGAGVTDGVPEWQFVSGSQPGFCIGTHQIAAIARQTTSTPFIVQAMASQTAPLQLFRAISSTPAVRDLGYVDATFVGGTTTDASYLGQVTLTAQDFGNNTGSNPTGRPGITVASNGTNADVIIPIANVRAAADDAAAAALTPAVPVGGIYRTASILKIRVS